MANGTGGNQQGGNDLQTTVANWPTPMAGTPAQNGNSAAGNNDFSRKAMELAGQMWMTPRTVQGEYTRDGGPTPASRDHKGENSPAHLENGTGRLHLDQLPNYVAHSFSRPDPAMLQAGMPPSQWRPTSRRLLRSVTSHVALTSLRRWLRRGNWRKRRLNPNFVEWLMGWPPGHALSSCSATEFSAWQQHMRGALSALPTAYGPWIWTPPAEVEPEPEQLGLGV